MTTAQEVQIADLIVSQYQAGLSVDGLTLEAARVSIHEWQIENFPTGGTTVQLLVGPVGQEIVRLDRGTYRQVDYKFLVGVGAKVPDKSNDVIDPLRLLMESAADYWVDHALTGRSEIWMASNIQEWPSAEQLKSKAFFLGAFELVFRGFRK